ncbi:MAG: DUF2461 domain-containing protein [Pseudomonadota bacterium]|nr:DUF2461 domain-containing protein [Pseudomonadota bacterium]
MPHSATPAGFTGFPAAALDFLHGLAEHQRREWFDAHRQTYEQDVRAPMIALVEALAPLLRRRRIPLLAEPKLALFRIHRDVRFAADKRPYKTHAAAAFTRSGAKMDPGMLYVHVDPLGCFAATGFYRPPPDALRALRRALVERSDDWRAVLAALRRAGHVLEADEDALQRVPRGFEQVDDPGLRDWLRWKSFIVLRRLGEDEIADPGLPALLAEFASQSMPLLRFGWELVDRVRSETSPPSAP